MNYKKLQPVIALLLAIAAFSITLTFCTTVLWYTYEIASYNTIVSLLILGGIIGASFLASYIYDQEKKLYSAIALAIGYTILLYILWYAGFVVASHIFG